MRKLSRILLFVALNFLQYVQTCEYLDSKCKTMCYNFWKDFKRRRNGAAT
jgi:hypothetical protein